VTAATVVLNVRVPKPMAEDLRRMAEANRRTLGMTINIVLEEGTKRLQLPAKRARAMTTP
jgi:hypothetical protein